MTDLTRLRIDLAYDGTDFAGWARQPGQRTVQDELERSLATVLRLVTIPTVTCAGRTDAGVHAREQVVHVDIPATAFGALPAIVAVGTLSRRLAGVMPRDTAIRSVIVAPDGFHARYSALWRRYRYRVCDEPGLVDPWRKRDTLVFSRPLDVDALNAASRQVVGLHDFAAFCRKREGATTIRTVHDLEWRRESSSLVTMTIRADAFCHTMVRSLVGALLKVGDGTRDLDWFRGYTERGVRGSDTTVARPQGLVLEHVEYPDDGALAERAALTRARREL